MTGAMFGPIELGFAGARRILQHLRSAAIWAPETLATEHDLREVGFDCLIQKNRDSSVGLERQQTYVCWGLRMVHRQLRRPHEVFLTVQAALSLKAEGLSDKDGVRCEEEQ